MGDRFAQSVECAMTVPPGIQKLLVGMKPVLIDPLKDKKVKISTAKIEITPNRATNPFLAGYGVDTPRQVTTDTPNTPLFIRCLILWDDGKPYVFVVADVLGFSRPLHQAIRARVLALHPELISSRFILHTTHTHNGPVLTEKLEPFISYNLSDLTRVERYSAFLEDQIVGLVRIALGSPQTTGTLDYQSACANFAFNRAGLPHVETDVPTLTVRNSDGAPIAVLFSYGCHPVSTGILHKYDGDYPAIACQIIEQQTGALALFVLGPAGDQDPGPRRGESLRDELGQQLSGTVLEAIRQVGRPLAGILQTKYTEVSLPLELNQAPTHLAELRAQYMIRQANTALPGYYRRHAERMIQQIDAGTFETRVMLPIQLWQFAGNPDLRMVLTGGELVSGYGAYFRARYRADGLLLAGYTNEVPAYIPTDTLLPPGRTGGSYEGGWDTDFPALAGGSQTVYDYISHFPAGANGVEARMIAALEKLLEG